MATVMIVEDNADIAGLYERALAQHETHTLRNIPDAIGHLQQGCPDLMILDFHLEGDSGLRLLKYLRASHQFKHLPVLGISADDMLVDAARKEGINAFLAKPFRVSDLIKTAQNLLNTHEVRPSPQMQSALQAYAEAYYALYKRQPTGQWVHGQVIIEEQPRDIHWLEAETRRLRSLARGGNPRTYLQRIIDKLRKM